MWAHPPGALAGVDHLLEVREGDGEVKSAQRRLGLKHQCQEVA